MILLGIDPGLAILGYGVIETDGHRLRLLQYGTVLTEAGTPIPERLKAIQTGVRNLIQLYKPDEIAFEELFFARNVTTALQVGAARARPSSPPPSTRTICMSIHPCRSSRP